MKYSQFGIAPRIVKHREKTKLKREQLALAVGISKQRLGRIERADTSPTIDELVKIAAALDVPLVSLIYGEDPGLIDIRSLWPSSRAVVRELVARLRIHEQIMHDDWEEYCRDKLGLDFIPSPPWRNRRK